MQKKMSVTHTLDTKSNWRQKAAHESADTADHSRAELFNRWLIHATFEQQHNARRRQQHRRLKATDWAAMSQAVQRKSVQTPFAVPQRLRVGYCSSRYHTVGFPELLSTQPCGTQPIQQDYREQTVLAINTPPFGHPTPASTSGLLQLTIPEADGQSAHQPGKNSGNWQTVVSILPAGTASACMTHC